MTQSDESLTSKVNGSALLRSPIDRRVRTDGGLKGHDIVTPEMENAAVDAFTSCDLDGDGLTKCLRAALRSALSVLR